MNNAEARKQTHQMQQQEKRDALETELLVASLVHGELTARLASRPAEGQYKLLLESAEAVAQHYEALLVCIARLGATHN